MANKTDAVTSTVPQNAEQMMEALRARLAAEAPETEFVVTVYHPYSNAIHAQFPATSLAYAMALRAPLEKLCAGRSGVRVVIERPGGFDYDCADGLTRDEREEVGQ